CLPPGAQRVLDLGAGTGKLTRELLALGLDVVAVEPLDGMRERIPSEARVLAGSAEEIPIEDATADAFTPETIERFSHEHEMDADTLVAAIASRSPLLIMPPDERDASLTRVR